MGFYPSAVASPTGRGVRLRRIPRLDRRSMSSPVCVFAALVAGLRCPFNPHDRPPPAVCTYPTISARSRYLPPEIPLGTPLSGGQCADQCAKFAPRTAQVLTGQAKGRGVREVRGFLRFCARQCALSRNRERTGDPHGNTGALAASSVHGANRKRETPAKESS
jgi:hypothetical protein